MRDSEQCRRWIEVVHLRSGRDDVAEVAGILGERLAEAAGFTTVVQVRMLRNQMSESDLRIHIHHETRDDQMPDQGLGRSVIELCAERGLINRTLWIEMELEAEYGQEQ